MQYSFSALALLAVAGLAAAQIPACAQPCLDSATKDACGDAKDFACACTPANQAKIQNAATTCVLDACGPTVAVQEVLPAAKALCDNLPASSSAAPASTSSEAAPSSTAAVTSSSAAASSYAASSALSTSTAVVPVTTGSSNGTVAPTSTPAPFTGGAAQATAAGLGSVFALGMAALAAF